MIYEVLIVKNPTKKEAEDGKQPELVTDSVKLISAANEQAAGALAMRKHGQAIDDADLDRAEVLIRPFGNPSKH